MARPLVLGVSNSHRQTTQRVGDEGEALLRMPQTEVLSIADVVIFCSPGHARGPEGPLGSLRDN